MRTPVSSRPETADPDDVTGLEMIYRELRERADCLARHLRAMGVREAAILDMSRNAVRPAAR